MVSRGFYKIKDAFFNDFPDDYLKTNNNENRPCYFCFIDMSTGLSWMIPMSKQIDKYKALIKKRCELKKPCDIVHVARLDNGKESVFLIQDMFPITDEYVSGDYTFNGTLLRVTSDALASTIEHKARTILGLIRKGIRLQAIQPDVLRIERELLNKSAGT
jgi:hypothetical protein